MLKRIKALRAVTKTYNLHGTLRWLRRDPGRVVVNNQFVYGRGLRLLWKYPEETRNYMEKMRRS